MTTLFYMVYFKSIKPHKLEEEKIYLFFILLSSSSNSSLCNKYV